jgi:polar amino acid transport system substrate-binding protein
VQSARVDAMVGTRSGLRYLEQQNDGISIGGPSFLNAPLTYAVPKGSPLAQVLKNAIDRLIADGSYLEVLNANNLTDGAITKAEIIPGG